MEFIAKSFAGANMGFFQRHDLVYRIDLTADGERGGIQRPAASYQLLLFNTASIAARADLKLSLHAILETRSEETYLSDMETPSFASLHAAATMSGVRKLKVPCKSFFLSLPKTPYAQPCGIPWTRGKSSKYNPKGISNQMSNSTVIESNESTISIEQKYALEAAKRKREDGLAQFEQLHFSKNERLRRLVKDIWADHAALDALPMPINDDGRIKFLIVGAGLGGLVMAVKLIKKGFSAEQILLTDTAGGVGGTWYWNRYPGLHCDVESYCYLPLLEEMGYMPRQKYSSGTEIRQYLEQISEKFGLSKRVLLRTQVTDTTWNDALKSWQANVSMRRGDEGKDEKTLSFHADHVIIVSGLFPYPQVPKVPGLAEFSGPMLHTSRWDYGLTGGSSDDVFPEMSKLKDKVVGVIGTGATMIQALPVVAKYAKKVFVFQRTPSHVFTRGQKDTDPVEWREKIAAKPGWQIARMQNLTDIITGQQPEEDLVGDQWSRLDSYAAIQGSTRFGMITPENAGKHVENLMAMDLAHTERARARVSQIVKDEDTAKKLMAFYPIWCKRPTFSDTYLQTFNSDTVHLIDTDGKGLDAVTPSGIIANGQEYPIDFLILGTGYRSPSTGGDPGSRTGIKVVGRNGRQLAEKWKEEGYSTFHGVLTNGFPNLFIVSPGQAGVSSNWNDVIDVLSEHITSIIAIAGNHATKGTERIVIETSVEAEAEWGKLIAKGAAFFSSISVCTPGYLNLEGEATKRPAADDAAAMEKRSKGSIWYKGLTDYRRYLEKWREDGRLEGIEVTAS
ncbi:hypothetical protein HRS9139_01599 [Pyrenophora teres f. teres]|uniref:FAD NAD-binding domain-containing protein n=1 Tax=Pyrenophora teres f. teres TaxID=97479 RepID=A0A6S6VCT3_9PLEO|nr:hypothetical protein HRS9139_01599 [Pyrenophora teres f. teres]CAE7009584.1 FAD NAD-binding domain-containing protein [Pyrenophora teres f. teres]